MTPPNGPHQQLERFTAGTVINGRYEIISLLGKGGFGFVCKAYDRERGNEVVALKFLYASYAHDEKLLARFKRELVLAKELDHPNIIKAYDFGDAGGETYFISMEFASGESLSDKLKKNAPNGLPIDDAITYLRQIAQGLAYAHSKGIIHRDIKPSNILITDDGVVKITDFGIGRPITSEEKLTRTREVIGSAAYMSPEQCRGIKLGHASDIYSFGILAYELVVGKPPFDHPDAIVVLVAHESEKVPDCTHVRRDAPRWYSAMIEKACEKDIAARFHDMSEVLYTIERYKNKRTTASGKTPIILMLVGVSIAITIAIVITLLFLSNSP